MRWQPEELQLWEAGVYHLFIYLLPPLLIAAKVIEEKKKKKYEISLEGIPGT